MKSSVRLSFLRGKTVVQIGTIAVILLLWQFFPWSVINPNIERFLPTPKLVMATLVQMGLDGTLFGITSYTLEVLVFGMAVGSVLAIAMASMALASRKARYSVELLTTVMHPMPAVALVPLVLMWVGFGPEALIILVVQAAIWPLVLNLYTGFSAVSRIISDVGRNIGLGKAEMFFYVLVPAALPYVLSGFKTSWARAWMTVIAGEMVFGASAVAAGLGYFIYWSRNGLDLSGVYAGTFVIMIMGILIERLFFDTLEKRTIVKWGMTKA